MQFHELLLGFLLKIPIHYYEWTRRSGWFSIEHVLPPRRVRISFLSVKYVPFVNVLNVQREGRKTGKGNIWTAKMILRNLLI